MTGNPLDAIFAVAPEPEAYTRAYLRHPSQVPGRFDAAIAAKFIDVLFA